jgi:hypothetical protein
MCCLLHKYRFLGPSKKNSDWHKKKIIAITDNNSCLNTQTFKQRLHNMTREFYMIRYENYLITVNLKSESKTVGTGEHQISQIDLS